MTMSSVTVPVTVPVLSRKTLSAVSVDDATVFVAPVVVAVCALTIAVPALNGAESR